MDNTTKTEEQDPGLPSKTQYVDVARCYQCHGHFGLVRSKFALKQFCSKACVENYKTDTERKISLIKEWRDYYAQKL
jgi:hypothetical protein